ncbi:MAG: hypothetical protein GEV09_21580 [Pseudonocardiaceae bacterium]|nr:hypothetical protein [Pseudonocardiaceae bacterium]
MRRAGRWMPAPGHSGVRHRGGVRWDVAPVRYRWHACSPQTVELYREHGVLIGTCRCACGAVTDRTGAWQHRNTRRHRDPAGMRRARTPQLVRAPVAAGSVPHPAARHHRRPHRASSA